MIFFQLFSERKHVYFRMPQGKSKTLVNMPAGMSEQKLDIPSDFALFILNLNFHDSSKFSR